MDKRRSRNQADLIVVGSGLAGLSASPGQKPCGAAQLLRLAARPVLWRAERRGAQFCTDFPASNPAWLGRILRRKGAAPRPERIAQ